MNAAFFDTNIFVYAAESDSPEPHKRDTARALLQMRSIVVSTQVMLELYGVLQKKLNYAADTAYRWVSSLRDDTIIVPEPSELLNAFMLARRYDISHYDGLILQAAHIADVDVVYTEDLNHGQTYGSVRVCNPFIEDFLE